MPEINWEVLQEKFLQTLLSENHDEAMYITRQVLSDGVTALEFFEQCITPSLENIGTRFENLDIFLPEMVEAASIVEIINREIVQPEIQKSIMETDSAKRFLPKGRILLATVQGDLHDIGKNIVATMLKVNGFDVIDAGTNLTAQNIIEFARREEAKIIGLSALLATTLPYMKDVIDLLVGFGLRDQFAVIVGGAAVTKEYAEEICADGYGRTAVDAVQICRNILSTTDPEGRQ